MESKNTVGVDVLLGSPRKAVLYMSIPLVIAMLTQTVNNFIDTFWVSGLSADAVAATGILFPLFFIIIGTGNGIGIGASSAISKHIGAKNKYMADRIAFQSLMITGVSTIVVTAFLLIFEKPLLVWMGSGDCLDVCIDYATPIFIGTGVFLFNAVLSNILRSEGNSRRAMSTQVIAAVINIVLDPFFIYSSGDLGFIPFGLGLGMGGAAWATVIAVLVSIIIQAYWLFLKRDTYLNVVDHKIRFHADDDAEILKVAVPCSLDFIVVSVATIFINLIIGFNGEYTDNIAVNSCVWKTIQLLMIPLMAIGEGIVPVLGAAYGANKPTNVKIAYVFSLEICVVLMILAIVLTWIFADQIITIFTYSDKTAYLKPEMARCLRFTCLILPFTAFGIVANGFFQSLGMGIKSLICSIIRNGLQIPFCYFIAFFTTAVSDLAWGIIVGEIIGSVLVGLWSVWILKKLLSGEISAFVSEKRVSE